MRGRATGQHSDEQDLRDIGLAAVAEGCLNTLDFEYLDLIVDFPEPQEGMREDLGIPEGALVILRFGGLDTFDIAWARDIVLGELERDPNLYFDGLNTEHFTANERAHFIAMVLDPIEKASIIACADVFLTARGQGEAFGLARGKDPSSVAERQARGNLYRPHRVLPHLESLLTSRA
jgi:hypothetical protein